jgi:hypothetical protein
MDARVAMLETPTECEIFARNATERKRPDLAIEARLKGIELRAATHEAASVLESESFAAMYAHDALLTRLKGKKARSTNTWRDVRRHGIIEAIERAVSRGPVATEYATLCEMGLEAFAFEALVLRHEAAFSPATVELAKERLEAPAAAA